MYNVRPFESSTRNSKNTTQCTTSTCTFLEGGRISVQED